MQRVAVRNHVKQRDRPFRLQDFGHATARVRVKYWGKSLSLAVVAEHHGRCLEQLAAQGLAISFSWGLIEPQMLSTESGLRAMSNQLLMNLFDGTESIVPEQQKVGHKRRLASFNAGAFCSHRGALPPQCNP